MLYIQISDAERKKVNKFRKLIKNTGKGKVFLGCIGLSIDLPDESLYRYLVSSNYGVVPACNDWLVIQLCSEKINQHDHLEGYTSY